MKYIPIPILEVDRDPTLVKRDYHCYLGGLANRNSVELGCWDLACDDCMFFPANFAFGTKEPTGKSYQNGVDDILDSDRKWAVRVQLNMIRLQKE